MSEENSKDEKIESTAESLLETVSDAEVNSRIVLKNLLMKEHYSVVMHLEKSK